MSNNEQSFLQYGSSTRENIRFKCTYPNCDKDFSRKSRLKAHFHLHNGSQPYRCPYDGCNKSFSERPNLKIHIRIHTNEKPFICKMCGKTFTTKGNMKDHERRHFKQKPFKCCFCSQTFYRKNITAKHEQTCREKDRQNAQKMMMYSNQLGVSDVKIQPQPSDLSFQ